MQTVVNSGVARGGGALGARALLLRNTALTKSYHSLSTYMEPALAAVYPYNFNCSQRTYVNISSPKGIGHVMLIQFLWYYNPPAAPLIARLRKHPPIQSPGYPTVVGDSKGKPFLCLNILLSGNHTIFVVVLEFFMDYIVLS